VKKSVFVKTALKTDENRLKHRKNSFFDRIIGNKELLPDEIPMNDPLITQIALFVICVISGHLNRRNGPQSRKSQRSIRSKEGMKNLFDLFDFAVVSISVPCAGAHESTLDEQNGISVICVALWRNPHNRRLL
jgi:hypothetical protein